MESLVESRRRLIIATVRIHFTSSLPAALTRCSVVKIITRECKQQHEGCRYNELVEDQDLWIPYERGHDSENETDTSIWLE